MASVCTDQYCIRPSAMLGLGQCHDGIKCTDQYCIRPSALLGLGQCHDGISMYRSVLY